MFKTEIKFLSLNILPLIFHQKELIDKEELKEFSIKVKNKKLEKTILQILKKTVAVENKNELNYWLTMDDNLDYYVDKDNWEAVSICDLLEVTEYKKGVDLVYLKVNLVV
jgi:hypothetical protein